MKVKYPKINICICTYRRTKSLENCLEYICKLEHPEEAVVVTSIIDNDLENSAKPIVESYVSRFSGDLFYFNEKKRGIPFARNRAIEESNRMNSDIIVFIDDDEWPESDWLVTLYDYYKRQKSDVIISGHVISDLPSNTPEDIRPLFNTKKRPTGARLSSCATNNVLIPMSIINSSGMRFDESSPLAGGTDTIFFCRLVRAGYSIFKCSEAIVHETIPENRLKLDWMVKRKYRAGITAAWRKRQAGRSFLGILGSAIIQIAVEMIKVAIAYMIGHKYKRNLSRLNIAKCRGVIAGLLGRQVESYQKIDGN